ncbi:HAMP domain-containing protein, partial [bacterium]|nr:HAMP domain-containing protein [bacterium]
LLINLGLVAILLSRETRGNPYVNAPPVTILEAYFLRHGSWQGVEGIFRNDAGFPGPPPRNIWENTILVDNGKRILLEHGTTTSPEIGTIYQPVEGVQAVPLIVNNQTVGKLYIERTFIPRDWSLVTRVLLTTFAFSILPGIVILVVGLLLLNRVLTPLSRVIGATQAVARGDLTARVPVHERNDDLQSLSQGFNHMAETLERNDRERRNLFADIAHELRTPLTILRGRLEGVIDGVYPPSQEVIAPALEETYLLGRLVEDLRLLALAEAHQLHFEIQDVEIGPLVQHVTELFSAQAAENKVALQSQIEDPSIRIHVDPQRFEQVISNLLDNALRYSPSGCRVDVVVRKGTAGIEIDVMDEGPGVAEDDLSIIFSRFWRGEKSRARTSGGSGLGLAIAKHLVESQGGTIQANNRSPHGLTIRVVVPGVAVA